MICDFDATTHTYFLDGVRVPSVTSVLHPIMPDYTYADPSRGTEVHALTERFDTGFVNEELPAEEWAYLAAWINFRRDLEFFPLHVEERVYHSLLRYAGTVDRIGFLGAGGEPIILDIKTGDPHPWHGVQLAGYVLAAERLGLVEHGIRRWGVYLSPEGYRYVEYGEASDFTVFQAALQLANWKASKG